MGRKSPISRTADIREFLSHVRSTPFTKPNGEIAKVKEATVHAYWKAVRSFFKWSSSDLGTSRPDQAIPMPKVPQPEVLPFTQNEIKAILKACEYTQEAKTDRRRGFAMKRPTRVRDRALILVLLDTGIRVGECARLKIRDVGLSSGEIAILPFGSGLKSKARHVYMGKACKSAVWKYIVSRADAREVDSLICNRARRSNEPLRNQEYPG
jgi:integrase/recombinase XerD